MILHKVGFPHKEQLEEYFGKYGEIKASKIICKHDSQVSRGFGFVIYVNRESAEEVIKYRDDHYINGKWIDCKSAILRQEMKPLVLPDDQANPSKKKKKKTANAKDISHGTTEKYSGSDPSKSYHHSGSGNSGAQMKVYNYTEEDPYYPSSMEYGYSRHSQFKSSHHIAPPQGYHDYHASSYKHMHSYDSYKYYQEQEDYNYESYPYTSSSHMNTYSPASYRVPPTATKKKVGIYQHPYSSDFQLQKEESEKTLGHHKGGFNESSPSRQPLSHQIPSEDASTKPSQPILPIVEDESSYPRNPGKLYHSPNYIPLIEEEEPEGYGDLYPMDDKLNSNPVNMNSLPNIGRLPNSDSPSNYRPFGTHFGPKILNRYGSNMDYFTPQAKNMVLHQYVHLPGDASTKSSTLKKNGAHDFKTMPTLPGFSSLAEQVVKGKSPHRETYDLGNS